MTRMTESAARRLLPAVCLLWGLLGTACGPSIQALPPDRHPADAWRGAAVPMPVGETLFDTLNVEAGDHTDWKSLAAAQRGTLVLQLRIYRHESENRSSGHLQILNPNKMIVLSQELLPEQEAYEVEMPVIHPGVWLVGISLRGGAVSYELKASWR